MSRTRVAVAAVTVIVLAVLLGWQVRRERMVRACVEGGGVWHGAVSACRRPFLQRDLNRS